MLPRSRFGVFSENDSDRWRAVEILSRLARPRHPEPRAGVISNDLLYSFAVPPHRYHIQRRIEQAEVMLAAQKHSVIEVASILGFSDASSFTTAFRTIIGETPARYQRNLG